MTDAGLPSSPPIFQLHERRSDSVHGRLRLATRRCHDEVDRLYGAFDLSDRVAYADFLSAHAQSLMPLETWLARGRFSHVQPRSDALRSDLAALGRKAEGGPALDWPATGASQWGAAYVIEGSRLGGAVLQRRVPAGLPSAYLSSRHQPGGWRGFLARLEEEAARCGPAWMEEAVTAARNAFGLFAQAARENGAARGA